jgi:hypothetical protein
MSELIKIIQSPFKPALEVVEDIVIILHSPYSDSNVTVQVNPNIQDYQDNADTEHSKVRQVIMTTPTDQTRRLFFDFGNNKTHRINLEGCDYEIELMNIGRENIQNQDFLFYEFNVTKHCV